MTYPTNYCAQGRYRADVAMAVNTLSIRLAELGRSPEALALAEEAAGTYRSLARADPTAHLVELAMSLNNLSLRYVEAGREADALTPAAEAAELYGRIAEADPDGYLPTLAPVLGNLGLLRSSLGQHSHALDTTASAVSILRRLFESDPGRYLADMARALHGYAMVRAVGAVELDEALAAVEEALDLTRPLAEQWPERFGAGLSGLVSTRDDVLTALAAVRKA